MGKSENNFLHVDPTQLVESPQPRFRPGTYHRLKPIGSMRYDYCVWDSLARGWVTGLGLGSEMTSADLSEAKRFQQGEIPQRFLASPYVAMLIHPSEKREVKMPLQAIWSITEGRFVRFPEEEGQDKVYAYTDGKPSYSSMDEILKWCDTPPKGWPSDWVLIPAPAFSY